MTGWWRVASGRPLLLAFCHPVRDRQTSRRQETDRLKNVSKGLKGMTLFVPLARVLLFVFVVLCAWAHSVALMQAESMATRAICGQVLLFLPRLMPTLILVLSWLGPAEISEGRSPRAFFGRSSPQCDDGLPKRPPCSSIYFLALSNFFFSLGKGPCACVPTGRFAHAFEVIKNGERQYNPH